jgi:hypothetical protein
MNAATDMRPVIVAKSDQLTADDLISGPRTITVTRVELHHEAEQKVHIFFEGDEGKPYRSCKSMSRVMVHVWGPDAAIYSGRSMTLYRDPNVKWGGMAVGGIRISHMSHMDREQTIALMETAKKKKIFRVLPLVMETPKPVAATTDAAATVAAELVAFADGIETADAMAEFDANPSITKRRDRLRDVRPELSRDVEAAVMAARARVTPTPAAKVEDDDVPF